jgi:hypothetical protein
MKYKSLDSWNHDVNSSEPLIFCHYLFRKITTGALRMFTMSNDISCHKVCN